MLAVAALPFIVLFPEPPQFGRAAVHWDVMVSSPRWNGATILLWLIGLAALGGAVLQGHRTASFLAGCVRMIGTIVDPRPHPIIGLGFTLASFFSFRGEFRAGRW